MTHIQQLLLIIIVNNAGGTGKTTTARLIKTLFELKDEPVQVLDGDPGNATSRVIDNSARVVGWGVDTMFAPNIVEDCRGQHVIVDLGANALASAREIVALLPALIDRFGKAGYRNTALLPIIPNKPGATEALVALADKLGAIDKIIVRNNLDGTGRFENIPARFPAVDLAHLQPGFMAYANDNKLTFKDMIMAPAEDHLEAGRYVAEWMRSFTNSMAFTGMFSQSAALLDHVPAPIGPTDFVIRNVDNISDNALALNRRKSQIVRLLSAYGWNAEGLRRAASEM